MNFVERIDKLSFEYLSILFFGIIILFGVLFFALTIYFPDHGISSEVKQIDLLTSIYFSAVTITSLGYGEIIPLGFSQLLVMVEIFFGLLMFGVIISKIVSGRQKKTINNMYSHLQRMHLRTYGERLRELRKEIRKLFKEPEINTREVFGTRSLTKRASAKMHGLLMYLKHEEQRDIVFFEDLDAHYMTEIVISVNKTLRILFDLLLDKKVKMTPYRKTNLKYLFKTAEDLVFWIEKRGEPEKLGESVEEFKTTVKKYKPKLLGRSAV
ncbi:MAG: two pore domain potassium channel family protein [Candidatus Aenigmarchaeota archaeon]|nr:two pore domain potassium channel family protein [Candidatus Aenigmarchaeota archaeon]